MWLMASPWVSWTTCVYTSLVTLIWLCPRIFNPTRGATPRLRQPEKGRDAVPGVMEPDDTDAGGLGDAGERAVHVARLHRTAGASDEDVVRPGSQGLPRLGSSTRLRRRPPTVDRPGGHASGTRRIWPTVTDDASGVGSAGTGMEGAPFPAAGTSWRAFELPSRPPSTRQSRAGVGRRRMGWELG